MNPELFAVYSLLWEQDVAGSSPVTSTSGESPRTIRALHLCGVRFVLCPRLN